MKKISRKILFFGNEKLATGTSTNLRIIKTLIDMDYKISAIVLPSLKSALSTQKLEIISFGLENNIPIVDFNDFQKINQIIKQDDLKIALLVSFGKIIPSNILNLFEYGIINVHPSLLPKHRGTTPIESAILDGDTETGISIIKLVPQMDTGPIYLKQKLDTKITNLSKQQIVSKLDELASNLIKKNFNKIYDQEIIPKDQNHSEATYDKMISKKDIPFLDPSNKTAQQLINEVRAYSGWPRSRIVIGNKEYIVTNASIKAGASVPGKIFLDHNTFGFYTLKNIFLIKTIIPPGKKEMDSKNFLVGYKNKFY